MRIMAGLVMLAIFAATAITVAAPRDACTLISKADIQRVLHWSVDQVSDEPYHVQMSIGTVCTYDAKDGAVIVVLPDSGSSFLGTNPLVEPQAMGEMVTANGVGDSAQIFDGTIYVKKHQRGFSIKIVPNNGMPSNADLVKLAKTAAAHMPHD